MITVARGASRTGDSLVKLLHDSPLRNIQMDRERRAARFVWRYPCSMLGEMLDTSPEARRIYYARLAQLTPAERLAMMRRSSRMIRRLAEASIRREHPAASPEEMRIRLAVRLYGREVAERLLGPVPADAR